MASNFEPNGIIRLCKTPLENDYKNQINFANATAQANYFNSKVVRSFDEYNYVRKDQSITLDCKIDDIIDCNYLFYRNPNFSNRTFYCFINKMEYVSESSTKVYLETDVFQTWMFSIQYHPCFVEREHVSDDTVGFHTIPEGLETGDYDIIDLRYSAMYEDNDPTTSDWCPCFCVTSYPSGITNLQSNGRIAGDTGYVGGVFSSLKFFATINTAQAEKIIDFYNSGHGVTTDEIKNIYMIPRCCVNFVTQSSKIDGYAFYPLYNYYESDAGSLAQPTVLSKNYQPKNNKLFTYPYSFAYATNNVGEQRELHWEEFPLREYGEAPNKYWLRTIEYKKQYVPSCGVSAKLVFTEYKGYANQSTYPTEMYNYGINFGKCPVCAWSGDYYTNWLTQNGVNMNANLVSGAVSGFATGALAGAMAGGIGAGLGGAIGAGLSLVRSIGSIVGETHKAETTPDTARGNINTGDYTFCFARNIISFYEMSIRPEFATIIDNYFTMFGYKVNVVKTLQFTSRSQWNYVKTVGCNLDGDIPQEDVEILRKMFDNGVTIWHNPANMYNYNLDNNIV